MDETVQHPPLCCRLFHGDRLLLFRFRPTQSRRCAAFCPHRKEARYLRKPQLETPRVNAFCHPERIIERSRDATLKVPLRDPSTVHGMTKREHRLTSPNDASPPTPAFTSVRS